jgi:hypothetical protein
MPDVRQAHSAFFFFFIPFILFICGSKATAASNAKPAAKFQ